MSFEQQDYLADIATTDFSGYSSNDRFFYKGYYATADGGEGEFVLDKTDTTTATNDGTIFAVTDGEESRIGTLFRLFSGPLVLNWFGLIRSDDGANATNTTAFNNAKKAAGQFPDTGSPGKVRRIIGIMAGEYYFDPIDCLDGVTPVNGLCVEAFGNSSDTYRNPGVGNENTHVILIFNNDGSNTTAISVNATHVVFKGIAITSNLSDTTRLCDIGFDISVGTTKFIDCSAYGFNTAGFLIYHSSSPIVDVTFSGCVGFDNWDDDESPTDGKGLWLKDTSGEGYTCILIEDCHFEKNLWGVYLEAGSYTTFRSCIIEGNREYGVVLDCDGAAVSGTNFNQCWFEYNWTSDPASEQYQILLTKSGGEIVPTGTVFNECNINGSGSVTIPHGGVYLDYARYTFFNYCSIRADNEDAITPWRVKSGASNYYMQINNCEATGTATYLYDWGNRGFRWQMKVNNTTGPIILGPDERGYWFVDGNDAGLKYDGNTSVLSLLNNNNEGLRVGTTGAVVVNDTGADADFRVEGDGDSNLLVTDAGNDRVGIGTATPGTKLDVSGTVTATGATVNGSSSLDGAVVVNNSGADVDFRVEGDTDANLLTVDAGTDRVGVGTNAPTTKLDVNGTFKASGAATLSSTLSAGATTVTDLTVNGSSSLDGAVVVNDSGADVDFRVEGNTDANLLTTDAGNDRVGIGTNAPTTKLDVNGTFKASGAATLSSTLSAGATTATGLTINGSSSLDGAVVINDSGADVDFRVEGDTDANLLTTDAGADRVGIGTGAPTAKLHVSTASGELLRLALSTTPIAKIRSTLSEFYSDVSALNPYGGFSGGFTNSASNPSFENGSASPWNNSSIGNNVAAAVTTVALQGIYSMSVTIGSEQDLRLARYGQSVVSGSTYSVSIYVYVPDTWDGGQISLGTDGTISGISVIANINADMSLTNQWQRITLQFTAGSTTSGDLLLRTASVASVGKVVYFDNFQVTTTNNVQPFSLLSSAVAKGFLCSDSLTVTSSSSLDGAVVVNDSGADVDFRVEGDTDANLLTTDAGNDRVGVGTNAPTTKLDVNGTFKASGAATLSSTLSAGATTVTGLTVNGSSSLDGAVVINDSGADVDFRIEGDTDANLLTTDAGTDRVGIGTNAPTKKLDIKGTASAALTGTVTVANASAAVTGTGTAFSNELAVGAAIKIDGQLFSVAAIASATSLTLDSTHLGGATGVTAYRDPALYGITSGDSNSLLVINGQGQLSIGSVTSGVSTVETKGSLSCARVNRPSTATFGGFADAFTNLIPNSSFETNTTDWTAGTSMTLTSSSDQALHGSKSLKVVLGANGSDQQLGYIYPASIQANTVYVFSAYVYVPSAWTGGQIIISDDGTFSGSTKLITNADMALRDQWQRLTMLLTTASDTDGVLSLRIDGSGVDTQVVYFDAVQVTQGADLFPFSPLTSAIPKGLSTVGELTAFGLGNSSFQGNLGVGIASPTTKLDVNGTFKASGVVTLSSTLAVASTTTLSDTVTITKGATLNNAGDDNDVRIKGQNDDNLLVADASADRIGIGTATPVCKLDIRSSEADNYACYARTTASSGSSSAGAQFENYSTSGTSYGVMGSAVGAASTNIAVYGIANSATNNYAAIFEQGKVGIGTTAPKATLHSTDSTILGAATSAVADGDLGNGQICIYLDESNNKLKFKVKYSGGNVKSGEVALS